MNEQIKFKKGDMVMIKVEKRESTPLYPRKQPMLIVSDNIQKDGNDILIPIVSFGIQGTLIHHFMNAQYLEYYTEDRNTPHYLLLACVSEYITAKISQEEMNRKIADVTVKAVDDKLSRIKL